METTFSCDQLVNWLLGSLRLETTVFHAGRYCGAWQASTAGRLLGSFHLVLDGQCWLHRPGHASIPLMPRDSVLFLRDVPHRLNAEPGSRIHHAPAAMLPLEARVPGGGTGLACGFFEFRGAMSHLLIDSLPEAILVRADDTDSGHLATVFELIRAEAGGDPEQPSPLLARLVEVLLFYAIRRAVSRDMRSLAGIWSLTRTTKMAGLLADVLSAPGRDWTVEQMATRVHMSRSNFCRHFGDLTGQSPAAFLATLRMRIAAQRLESGDSIERAADYVGYRSSAAFSRAFKKITGEQPGAWRRGNRPGGLGTVLQ
ncbi:AraC family transcriptional regulator [Pollutimonas bauzanensis]|uniref:AraC-type DNA-binding protein n=1 Tax=Pollutimonas bauzanensis TaxID=658167 RepID=A0A1M5ZU25_9BURK|nr:AraC family transcriptional regulator [Pollutimonas bauzanensis]SHI27453.1 AraC-type DNA-binding protein [Pollutimonas bauzanensis]